MSRARSRIGGALVTAVLLSSTLAGAPVAAADSPESAINEFFDMAASGEFDRIGEVVCAADQQTMREAFDLGEQLGLGDDELAQALTFQIEDRAVEVISEEGDTATVAVTATMSMDVPEDEMEAIVRAVMEADLGPDDPPVSDDDLEMMMGFVGSAFNQTQAIDQEVTVVREEGSWLVCGGLVDEPEGPTVDPVVSSEGMCGIATPDEISAAGSLEYDSSSGFGEYCSFSTADYDSFHSLSVSLGTGQDAAQLASFLGADQELTVAGSPAFATAPDATGNQLLVQVGDDLLQVSIFVDEGTEIDWLEELTAISELLIPRIPRYAWPSQARHRIRRRCQPPRSRCVRRWQSTRSTR